MSPLVWGLPSTRLCVGLQQFVLLLSFASALCLPLCIKEDEKACLGVTERNPQFPCGWWNRNACFALAWPWHGDYYMLDFGFGCIPVQHPASSTFAFPSAQVSPCFVQGQAMMGTYPLISEVSRGSHSAKATSGISTFPNIKTQPRVPQAPSSTSGLSSIPWAGGSGCPLPAVPCPLSPAHTQPRAASCPSANRFFRFSWPLPVFRS